MALTWNNNIITSDRTLHSARLIPGSLEYWEVSYLPGIPMQCDDAYMAMTIALAQAGRFTVAAAWQRWTCSLLDLALGIGELP